jgi:hypothetical protein
MVRHSMQPPQPYVTASGTKKDVATTGATSGAPVLESAQSASWTASCEDYRMSDNVHNCHKDLCHASSRNRHRLLHATDTGACVAAWCVCYASPPWASQLCSAWVQTCLGAASHRPTPPCTRHRPGNKHTDTHSDYARMRVLHGCIRCKVSFLQALRGFTALKAVFDMQWTPCQLL